MSGMNPMMLSPMGMQPGIGFPGTPGGGGGWPMGMNPMMGGGMQMGSPGMLSPAQFMPMGGPGGGNMNDPNFMAAHQQAMMIAKQAYQVAVAQQAMAAAADEWERSSNMGFGGGGSVYGGSVYGGGGGSVYGGGGGSVYGGGGGGMNNWSTGSAIMPPSSSSRSMFGGGGGMSSSRSEYGGGGGGRSGGWSSSKSSYGEYGGGGSGQSSNRTSVAGGRGRHLSAAGNRDSVYSMNGMAPVPPLPSSGSSKTLRQRTTSQPLLAGAPLAGPSPGRRAPPPSSWRNNGD
jgi:serine/arginine repetitive matrix protein 2